MSNQQASIKLTANIVQFKKQMEEAKAAYQAIGRAKLSSEASTKLKALFNNEMKRDAQSYADKIKNITKQLEIMATVKGPIDKSKIKEATRELAAYEAKLKEVKNAMGEGGGGGIGGMLKGGIGKLVAGAVAVAGVKASLSRRLEMGQERTSIRELGGQPGSERSSLGFTPQERRQQMLELTKAGGRNMSGRELTNLSNQGEVFQRAYGVSTSAQADSQGTARRAGADGGKYVANTIGSAVAAHLEGSRIGEFLQASSQAVEKMSEGINVDTGSLNGFAAALSSMPFFKSDPQRAFAAIANMSEAFSHGDRFQQAQAGRSISRLTGGTANAADMEMRRDMGLMGIDQKQNPDFFKQAQRVGGKGFAKTMKLSGSDIVNSMMQEAVQNTKGMDKSYRIMEIMKRMGLHGQGGAEIAMSAIEGKKINAKAFEKATKSPEEALREAQELATKAMNNLDGSIIKLNSKFQQMLDRSASNVADPISKMGNKGLGLMDKVTGGNGTDLMGDIIPAAAAGGAFMSMGGPGMVKGAMKGAGRLSKAFMKGGAKGGMKAAGRMAGKAAGKGIGKLIPGIGLLFAAKDAWDVYEKYQNGEEITPKDWAILGASSLAGVAGLVPGIGTAVSAVASTASAGLEFAPDNLGMPTSGKPGGGGSSAPTAAGMPPNSSGGTDIEEHQAAVDENTLALRQLTQTISGGSARGGGGGRRAGSSGRAVGK